jgi:hypothetical protein
MSITLKGFAFFATEHRGLPKGLVPAVIKQHGGWKSFRECALDFARNGVDGGFPGFIYYSETIRFVQKHRSLIAQIAAIDASDLGTGVIQMFQSFDRTFGVPKYSEQQVICSLYGDGKSDWDDGNSDLMNTLAWYAAEKVLAAYLDYTEEFDSGN